MVNSFASFTSHFSVAHILSKSMENKSTMSKPTAAVIGSQPDDLLIIPKQKRLHLISDPGFLQKYVGSLLSISFAAFVSTAIPSLQDSVTNAYFQLNEYMMMTAHRYAWWSLLGLLSSSCCALQLLLNAMSLGCAGFNTVLGPIRPISLAIATFIQTLSWYIARNRPNQWKTVSISTILVINLAFLPELLFWFQKLGGVVGRKQKQILKPDTTIYKFRLDNVGCAACVTTVTNVLNETEIVEDFYVSLHENGGLLTVVLKTNSSKNKGTVHAAIKSNDSAVRIVQKNLDEAGFPIKLLSDQIEQR